jgi:hypothetical protein
MSQITRSIGAPRTRTLDRRKPLVLSTSPRITSTPGMPCIGNRSIATILDPAPSRSRQDLRPAAGRRAEIDDSHRPQQMIALVELDQLERRPRPEAAPVRFLT